MIPIGDDNPSRRYGAVVNALLIAINVLIFLYELTLPPLALSQLIFKWGVVPDVILPALAEPFNAPPNVWASLITSQFLHAGWFHLIGNMLFLWIFGDNIEDALGTFTYLVFYLAGGVIAGIVQSIVTGADGIPAIGASGAIAGVLGAYLVLYPLSQIKIIIPAILLFWSIRLPALIVIGWWFVQQFLNGIGSLGEAAVGGVAFWAHIGGFVFGALMVLPFIPRARRRQRRVRYVYPPKDFYRS
ncbi:Rhomboid protease GluP [Anaerolineae bacterium]|nr:Rhomboid protease GluP [Anaerolineae bacterium]